MDYHSSSNNFTITGSLKMGDELRAHLQWKDAQVTREFEVMLSDAQGKPIRGGEIKIGGQSYVTGPDGKTSFSLVFNESNYNEPLTLQAWYSGKIVDQQGIDFFTETPVRPGQ